MPLDDSVEEGGLVWVAVDMRILQVTKNGPEFGPHAGTLQGGSGKAFLPSFAGEVSASYADGGVKGSGRAHDPSVGL
jgi:hypothetical protein